MSNKYYRVVEKRGKTFIVDIDGNVIEPDQAKALAGQVIEAADDRTYVYIGHRESDELYKIGRTNNLERRQAELGIKFIKTFECDLYGAYASSVVEAALHQMFKHFEAHIEGEWFDIGVFGPPLFSECKTGKDVITTIPKLVAEYDRIVVLSNGNRDVIVALAAQLIESSQATPVEIRVLVWLIDDLVRGYKKEGDEFSSGYMRGVFELMSVTYSGKYAELIKRAEDARKARGE